MEIKFRGKCNDEHSKKFGKWIFGGVCDYESGIVIFELDCYAGSLYEPPHTYLDEYEVERETVGQFTGLRDKNDKEIYTGDIVNVSDFEHNRANGEVRYEESACCYRVKGSSFDYPLGVFQEKIEVIGNIYDNPELLGVQK